MFDLPYFVSDSSYGYQSDLHDDNFVRRKQRRNRTTFTVQQVKEKIKRTFSWTFHLLSTSFLNWKIWVFNLHPLFCTWAEFSVSRIFENCVLRVGNTCKRTSLGLVAWKEIVKVSILFIIFFSRCMKSILRHMLSKRSCKYNVFFSVKVILSLKSENTGKVIESVKYTISFVWGF